EGRYARIRVGELNVGRIARERTSRVVNSIIDEPAGFDLQWVGEHRLTAFAGLPLLVEDRLVGVMAVFSREAVAEDVLDALYGVADLLAQGIERKRAEEALRASEERFRA